MLESGDLGLRLGLGSWLGSDELCDHGLAASVPGGSVSPSVNGDNDKLGNS